MLSISFTTHRTRCPLPCHLIWELYEEEEDGSMKIPSPLPLPLTEIWWSCLHLLRTNLLRRMFTARMRVVLFYFNVLPPELNSSSLHLSTSSFRVTFAMNRIKVNSLIGTWVVGRMFVNKVNWSGRMTAAGQQWGFYWSAVLLTSHGKHGIDILILCCQCC